MASARLLSLLNAVLDAGSLSDETFVQLRRQVYEDGYISTEEADLIFDINTAIKHLQDEWNAFFVGAITDFLVRQTPPTGFIDISNAAWLMQRIDHDGVIELETEFELLMNVLHLAQSVPERLERFAWRRENSCVVKGSG